MASAGPEWPAGLLVSAPLGYGGRRHVAVVVADEAVNEKERRKALADWKKEGNKDARPLLVRLKNKKISYVNADRTVAVRSEADVVAQKHLSRSEQEWLHSELNKPAAAAAAAAQPPAAASGDAGAASAPAAAPAAAATAPAAPAHAAGAAGAGASCKRAREPEETGAAEGGAAAASDAAPPPPPAKKPAVPCATTSAQPPAAKAKPRAAGGANGSGSGRRAAKPRQPAAAGAPGDTATAPQAAPAPEPSVSGFALVPLPLPPLPVVAAHAAAAEAAPAAAHEAAPALQVPAFAAGVPPPPPPPPPPSARTASPAKLRSGPEPHTDAAPAAPAAANAAAAVPAASMQLPPQLPAPAAMELAMAAGLAPGVFPAVPMHPVNFEAWLRCAAAAAVASPFLAARPNSFVTQLNSACVVATRAAPPAALLPPVTAPHAAAPLPSDAAALAGGAHSAPQQVEQLPSPEATPDALAMEVTAEEVEATAPQPPSPQQQQPQQQLLPLQPPLLQQAPPQEQQLPQQTLPLPQQALPLPQQAPPQQEPLPQALPPQQEPQEEEPQPPPQAPPEQPQSQPLEVPQEPQEQPPPQQQPVAARRATRGAADEAQPAKRQRVAPGAGAGPSQPPRATFDAARRTAAALGDASGLPPDATAGGAAVAPRAVPQAPSGSGTGELTRKPAFLLALSEKGGSSTMQELLPHYRRLRPTAFRGKSDAEVEAKMKVVMAELYREDLIAQDMSVSPSAVRPVSLTPKGQRKADEAKTLQRLAPPPAPRAPAPPAQPQPVPQQPAMGGVAESAGAGAAETVALPLAPLLVQASVAGSEMLGRAAALALALAETPGGAAKLLQLLPRIRELRAVAYASMGDALLSKALVPLRSEKRNSKYFVCNVQPGDTVDTTAWSLTADGRSLAVEAHKRLRSLLAGEPPPPPPPRPQQRPKSANVRRSGSSGSSGGGGAFGSAGGAAAPTEPSLFDAVVAALRRAPGPLTFEQLADGVRTLRPVASARSANLVKYCRDAVRRQENRAAFVEHAPGDDAPGGSVELSAAALAGTLPRMDAAAAAQQPRPAARVHAPRTAERGGGEGGDAADVRPPLLAAYCAQAAAKDRVFAPPAAPGPGVVACHQCAKPVPAAGRACCFAAVPGASPCGAVYCDKCAQTCYPRTPAAAFASRCPKCAGCCVCAVCSADPRWVDAASQPLPLTAAERARHAAYLLRMVKAPLLELHKEQEAALGREGYAAIPSVDDRGTRVMCDSCGTAIADVFYGCADARCGAEFCVPCGELVRACQLRDVKRRADAGGEGDDDAAAAEAADAGVAEQQAAPAAFASDTPEAEAALHLQSYPRLQPSSVSPTAGSSAAGYLGAMSALKVPASAGYHSLERWTCPCDVHRRITDDADTTEAADPQPPARRSRRKAARQLAAGSLPVAVLLLQRRYPRVVIPSLLGQPEVRAMPDNPLGARRCTGAPGDAPIMPDCCPWCACIAAATVPNAAGVRDLRSNPNLRRAANRGSPDDWLWTPLAADVDPRRLGPERYAEQLRHFQWHWRRGQFPIVRGITPGLQWVPAMLKLQLERTVAAGAMEVTVCRNNAVTPCSVADFIAGYEDVLRGPWLDGISQPGDLLKLKDWPPKASFKDTVPQFYADFQQSLPFPEYTDMLRGALNLSRALPASTVPPDQGPKMYTAYGVEAELPGGGDSVTRLHQDMSDAVNVLLHSAKADGNVVAAAAAMGISRAAAAAAATAAAAAAAEAAAKAAAPPAPADVYETSKLGPPVLAASQDAAAAAAAATHAAAAAAVAPGAPMPPQPKLLDETLNMAVWRAPDCTPCDLGPRGALWSTWRREESRKLAELLLEAARLRERLKGAAAEAVLAHAPTQRAERIKHAIHDQVFYLADADLARMRAQSGVEPWSFAQHDNEAVFIPAGCPHQVRNLRSCIKVALDFVAPESAGECVQLAKEFAAIQFEEKLQARLMMLHAAQAAVATLRGEDASGAGGSGVGAADGDVTMAEAGPVAEPAAAGAGPCALV